MIESIRRPGGGVREVVVQERKGSCSVKEEERCSDEEAFCRVPGVTPGVAR